MRSYFKRYGLLLTVVVLSMSFVGSLKLASSLAQDLPQQETKLPPWKEKIVGYERHGDWRPNTLGMTERIIENRIPLHLPIKVKLKNLDLDPILQHLVVEVTNTSKKPMYYVDLTVLTPEVLSDEGHPIGFALRHGRTELLNFDNPLRPDDVALQPGESEVFRIADTNLAAWDLKRGLIKTELKLLYLHFSQIRFGDSTGYVGLTGASYPPVRNNHRKSYAYGHVKRDINVNRIFPSAELTASSNSVLSNFYKFSFLEKARDSTKETCPRGLCCWDAPGFYCGYLMDDTYACNCGTGRTFQLLGCTDPRGRCAEPVAQSNECVILGQVYTCTEYTFIECPPPWPGSCRNPYVISPTDTPCIGCCGESPIVIDIQGDGTRLTSTQGGVNFDLNNDNTSERIAWTSANGDDAFLVLDRNGNGTIDNGNELFGNYSPQPPSVNPNGFISLAEFDKQVNGGNRDGRIDSRDSVFQSLRLWQDLNHNAISEAGELRTLQSVTVRGFDLDYRVSLRTDEYGNQFRYRAKVFDRRNGNVGTWAWDVWLMVEQ